LKINNSFYLLQSHYTYIILISAKCIMFILIPDFPMDGGRVLRAILATRKNYGPATQIAASIGQAIAIFIGIIKFIRSIPLSKAMDSTLLVYEMNGQPLLLEHGYHLRSLALQASAGR